MSENIRHDSFYPELCSKCSPNRNTLPNPTPEQLESPVFNAIWSVVKTWDVNVPEYYAGYCGANGSHVCLILEAIQPFLSCYPQMINHPTE